MGSAKQSVQAAREGKYTFTSGPRSYGCIGTNRIFFLNFLNAEMQQDEFGDLRLEAGVKLKLLSFLC